MNAFAGAPLYMMWTALHVPAITLPVCKGPNGLPIGVQLFANATMTASSSLARAGVMKAYVIRWWVTALRA